MNQKNTLPRLAPQYRESARPVFKDQEALSAFWCQMQKDVKPKLKNWDVARAKSEEEARHLWVRRQPATD
jgi:hypothetical protein